MSTSLKAALILLLATVFGALISIFSKIAVASLGPFSVWFFRFFIATLIISPFLLRSKPWKNKYFYQLFGLSILSMLNTGFFIWAIQYTTATVSQILYAAMPILIIVFSKLIWNQQFSRHKIFGVILGLFGILYIVYLSIIEKGATISGTFIGNIGILIAMLSWMSYTLFSKKVSQHFSPIIISSFSILTTALAAFVLFLYEINFTSHTIIFNWEIVVSLLYLSIFGSVVFLFLYQYGIKHSSALTASLTSYIQPIFAAFFAYFLLGERLTLHFFLGSILVLTGVFITTTYELHQRRSK